MTWSATAPYKPESVKIRWDLVRYTRGRGLDLGCGPVKPFQHFIGVDNGSTFMGAVHPDIVCDIASLSMFADRSMDFAYSSHALEDFPYEAVPAVLAEWWRVIKVGGYLILYVPDEDTYPKVGEEGANPAHKWNVNYDRVVEAMQPHDFDLVDFQKRSDDDEYSLFFVFKKYSTSSDGSIRNFSWQRPRHPRRAGVVRYGAFGDLLQASSVFAGLKELGYHVTLYTSPPGLDVVTADPNIDELFIQDKDQVPNACLAEFWAHEKKKYDHWVNLSETVEGSLLTLPGRTLHGWTPRLRHRLMNHNYLEVQHELAGVPHKPRVKFFPTLEESLWAAKERQRLGGQVVLWALSGSSVHKVWAGLDPIVARILTTYPRAQVVFCGGPSSMLLEQGWELEPRVHRTCGKWSIRQTLAFAQLADLVIGPETGVLNAVSQEHCYKIVFLSHSTPENLTRDWSRTIALQSEDTRCPGRGENEAPACHMMHYTWESCKRTSNGVSQCMEDLTLDQVWSAVVFSFEMFSHGLINPISSLKLVRA
jgi:ADP-heptose:LPS heptosyltransferase